MDKLQLLCTFATKSEYKNIVLNLQSFYTKIENKIFVLTNSDNLDEMFLTYNVLSSVNESSRFPNTISIHRKKQTNTLYTLNAMNKIIQDENAGIMDKTFKINWQLYQNCLITTSDSFIKIIPTNIFDIIN